MNTKTVRQIDQELVESMREQNLKNAEILDELSAEAQELGMYECPARGVVDDGMVERVAAALAESGWSLGGEPEEFLEDVRTALEVAQAAAQPVVPSVPEGGDTFAAISAEMREVVNGYDFDRDHDLSEWAKRIDALAALPAVPALKEHVPRSKP